MFKLSKALYRNQKGFTLVELMVVVVIIGVLVAIAIPVFNRVQANSARRAVEANLRTIEGAISQYVAERGTNPADIAALVANDYLIAAPTGPRTSTYAFTTPAAGDLPRATWSSGAEFAAFGLASAVTDETLPITWP